MTAHEAPNVVPVTKLALSFRETCEYVGLCRNTIYKLISMGNFPKPTQIPHTKVQRFDAAAVRAWWEDQCKDEGKKE